MPFSFLSVTQFQSAFLYLSLKYYQHKYIIHLYTHFSSSCPFLSWNVLNPNSGAGEIAQGVRVLTAQTWRPEFRVQHPRKKLGITMQALGDEGKELERGKSLGLIDQVRSQILSPSRKRRAKEQHRSALHTCPHTHTVYKHIIFSSETPHRFTLVSITMLL